MARLVEFGCDRRGALVQLPTVFLYRHYGNETYEDEMNVTVANPQFRRNDVYSVALPGYVDKWPTHSWGSS